jgi:hypothetical protein
MARGFGRPIEAGGRILVPVAESLRLRAPGGVGGLVWNRPVGVRIEEADGSRYLPIRDRTREIQWLLLGIGLAAALWIRLARRGGFMKRFH